MRTNGQIRFLIPQAGDLNQWGEATATEEVWGYPLPCSIMTNSDTRKGRYEDGQFRQSSYTVLLEDNGFIDGIRVRLEREGENLGEFQIQTIERLGTVGRVRIIV